MPIPAASCPACNAPLEGDELFCLQCGARLAPDPGAAPGWRLPAAIVAGIALIALAATLLALRQVESDAEREATKPAQTEAPVRPR